MKEAACLQMTRHTSTSQGEEFRAMDFHTIMQFIGNAVDAAGVTIILVGAAIASFSFLRTQKGNFAAAYRSYRQGLGRAILLGLEFLVAGDIIRTVAVSPTLENVWILALIVVIRTFLSMALQMEVDGRLPWRRGEASPPNRA
jgi:uncharacterized membrane protein